MESAALHKLTGRTAGNGSLMRTAPVALAYLDDEAALAEAARAVSELTHYDPEAGDACVLWCLAMRHVKTNVPSFEELGLLPQVRSIAESPRPNSESAR